MKRAAHKRTNFLSSSIFARWGGPTAALGGLLFVAWGYIDRDDGEAAPPYFDSIANALAVVVPLLFAVGLVGFYARCRGRVGWIGGMGLILGVIGAAWGAAFSVVDTTFWYVFWHVHAPGNERITWLLNWITLLFVGLMLIGIGAIIKKVFRDLGVLLLLMGVFGWIYYVTDSPGGLIDVRSVHVAFGLLFSLGWVVLGCALWLEEGKEDRPNANKRG